MAKALLTLVIVIISGIVIGTTATKIVGHQDNDKQVLSTKSSEQKEQKPVEVPGVPVSVRIPSINVDTEVESVGNDSEGRMDVPKDDMNTSWYNPGFRPGQQGNAVLAGHFDKKDGSPAIFWDLKTLQKGDEIFVTDDKGKERKFEVVKTEVYPDAEFPLKQVFGGATDEMLNLITCHGDWNKGSGYSDRYVVYSKLVE